MEGSALDQNYSKVPKLHPDSGCDVSNPIHHSSSASLHAWGRQLIPAHLPLQVQHSSPHSASLTFLLPGRGKLSLPKYPHFQQQSLSFLHHCESLPSPPASLSCFPTTASEPLEPPKAGLALCWKLNPAFSWRQLE